jgi:tetratricopeptide (TPR) repeat protein
MDDDRPDGVASAGSRHDPASHPDTPASPPDTTAQSPVTDPASPYRYWAFISYSSTDRSWARWLQRGIESYGIPARLVDHATPTGEPPPKRFKPLFRDRSELAAGDLGAQIEEALQASRYLIVVCSPRAAASEWVNKEIASFQALGRGERIFAVVVDGEPNAGDERECFPPALRDTEPLAADARPEGDGKRDARLKLLAGMLGVGFDALKQRDQHRRMRRLQAVVAAVLVLAAGFAGLAAYAFQQRSTANEQRSEAIEQRDKAVAARTQVESILDYLLTDLRDQLEPIGQQAIVADVRRAVDEYYRGLGVEPGESGARNTQAVEHCEEGDRLLDEGDLDGALREYEASLKIMQELADSDPANIAAQRDLATYHRRVGDVLWEQDDLGGGLEHYEASLEIIQRLIDSDPGNADWQFDLSESHYGVGLTLETQGDSHGALEHFQARLEILQGLVDSDPGNAEWREALGVALGDVGDILETQGDLDAAMRYFRAALKNLQAAAASDPENTEWQHDLALSRNDVGRLLESRGRLDAALQQYAAALEIMKRLAASDTANAEWEQAVSDLRDAVKRCST